MSFTTEHVNEPVIDLTELESEWMTRSEAARYLNVTARWLALGGRRLVPSFKFGGQVRYSRTELDRWAKAQREAVR